MKNIVRLAVAGGSVAALAAITGPATANHAWSTYHWDTGSTTVVSVPIMDNVSGVWEQHLDQAIVDWNKSAHINATEMPGSANTKRCPITSGQIDVCNDTYGSTGWLGIASIALSNGHISGGVTKVNDTYFNTSTYNNDTWRQLVMCQEIGHDYGLGHQNEDFNTDLTTSCMEYTNQPAGNEGPDAHDYNMLAQIYGHTHGGSGGGGEEPCKGGWKKCGSGNGNGKMIGLTGAGPADWGRAVGFDKQGRANVYSRRAGGYTIITHVTWAMGYQPDHH
ncbi:hypothetical protein [Sphingomicrobium lutaoense]|uniref:Uncharacterized protein n=1 Tax=Sphingomicrobium lutaoense TaxID=515949 RepID=A0A839Z2B4_9SPHN|nr:hypothetical protein [Sphingomicrobium lutaoense]MBB3764698.1 hypothetical protein [Sphingomicrobium lutaoense]